MIELMTQRKELKSFALCYNNFRVCIIGSLITRIGDWMDLVALNWAVLQLTGSAFYLGLISACRLLPVFTMSVPAGDNCQSVGDCWPGFGRFSVNFC